MKKIFMIVVTILVIIEMLNAKDKWLDIYKQREPKIKEIVEKQIDKIHNKANSTNSGNEENLKGFVLSTHIKNFKDISPEVEKEIEIAKQDIASLIRIVATDIEINQNQYSGSLKLEEDGEVKYIPSKNLPKKLNEKKEKLLKANMKNSVSVKSAVIALKLLRNINNEIIKQAKNAKNKDLKTKLYIKQAVYVYEMSSIVLEFLDSISLDGVSTLKEIYQDTKTKIASKKREIEKQKDKAKKLYDEKLISKESLDKELSSLDLMEKASEKTLDTWKDVFSIIGKQEEFINNIKRKKKLVEYKKEKAKLQIETLRDIRSVTALKSMVGSIDELVDNIDQLDLLVLDEETVSKLLGAYEN